MSRRRGSGEPRGGAPVGREGSGEPRGGAPVTRITLYTRVGCHLCEEAERVLRQEQAATPFRLELVDIDHDPELIRRYGVRVPVVALDGKDLFDYEVPVDLLRAWLGRVGAD
jgi:glutaredoxin